MFPQDVVRKGRDARWPWIFLGMGPLVTAWAFGLPFPVPGANTLALVGNVATIALVIALLMRSYRDCGAIGRRQMKWVLLGFLVGLGPALMAAALALAVPELWWLYELCLALAVVTPVCLFVALVRYQLFDVDRLITTAATYTVLGITAIAGVFLVAPRAAQATAGWIEPSVGQPLMSVVLGAAVFLGLRQVDRGLQERLYPERARLRDEAQLLARDLGECEKPAEVLSLVGRRLASLLSLDTVAIYGRAEHAFAPVFARGRAVSPGFDPDGPLAAHLEAFPAPLETEALAELPAHDPDHAALRSMAVELVVPVRIGDELAAFVCLGGKRSEDLFTRTDQALLQGIADRAADVLDGFGRAVVERENRELMRSLKSYVPGAVASEIEAGAPLDTGEAIVSMLFVDVRGYTSFSEGRRASAIFEAVSAYTSLAGRIVKEHGGWVVDFQGDGLMAVFGAPQPLEQKERCAVDAALEIVDAVPKLELRDADGRPVSLDVGVGIATGETYVGTLRTVDRSLWVALGNTTNLAARLEGSTRKLGVSVVIDDPTRAAAGAAAADFTPHGALPVKGRRTQIDVHTFTTPALAARLAEEGGS